MLRMQAAVTCRRRRLVAVAMLATFVPLLVAASMAQGGRPSNMRVISYVRGENNDVGVVVRVVAGRTVPCTGTVRRGKRRFDLSAGITNGHGAVQWSWEVAAGLASARWHAVVRCTRQGRERRKGKRFDVDGVPGRRKGSRLYKRKPYPENAEAIAESTRKGNRSVRFGTPPGFSIRLGYTRRPDLPDLGDARDWVRSAKAKGFPIGPRPLKGAIAWFPPNRNGVGPFGHVAYVAGVSGDMITIEEYDGKRPIVRTRPVPWSGLQFIYRQGQSPPPPPPSPNTLPSVRLLDAPGTTPSAITWDGTSSWIGDKQGTIFKLDANRQVAGSFQAPPGSFAAFRQGGLVFTGPGFAVFNMGVGDPRIYDFVVTDSTATETGSFASPPIDMQYDAHMTWDGSSLWFANGYKVHQLTQTGAELSNFSVGTPIDGIASDGRNLWLAHSGSYAGATLDKVSPTGARVARYTTSIPLMEAMTWINGSLLALGGGFGNYGIFRVQTNGAGLENRSRALQVGERTLALAHP
jgi:surface antigen